MTFALPVPVLLAGAVLIAGLLFALQRLRVRERVVALAGAMLWRQAARVTPPRILTERFRRWLAYLLALAIALLLWIGAGRPERVPGPTDRHHVFYLDAAAPMMAGNAYAEARRALIADVATVPAAQRTVYLGDPDDATVLEPGEPVALLARRLRGVQPAPRPSGFARWTAGFASAHAHDGKVVLHYYGSAAATAQARRHLPSAITLSPDYVAPATPGNRGIVALGASPAASGAWDRADILVAVAAADGSTVDPAALSLSRGGIAIDPGRLRAIGNGRFVVRDVAADGGTITAALPGDAFPADDRATLTLPMRRPIRIAIAPGVPPAMRAVIDADPALVPATPDAADVVIRRAGDRFGNDRPAMILTGPAAQADTFLFATADADERAALSDGLDRLGLADLDAARLADDLRRPVAVGFAAAPRRTISVWATIFAPGSGFATTRAMPLFVAQGVRWLAGPAPWVPYAGAGRPLLDQSELYGLVPDPAIARQRLGGDLVPAGTGAYRLGARQLSVALLDRETTMAAAAVPPPLAARHGAGGGIDPWFAVVMAAAALLLAVEWILYRRGVMP